MNPLTAKTSQTSGQVLIIVVLLGLILVVGGTVAVLFNQTESRHQIAGTQRGQNRTVAEEGLSVGIERLGRSRAVWQNAMGGDFSGTECNTGNLITGPSGRSFKLYCSVGTAGTVPLQSFQVALTAVGYTNTNGTWTPLRAVRAFLSERTLGMDSANNIHAAAALQLVLQPTIVGQLNVHWGPLVCLDAASGSSWYLPEPIDSQRYPRKFSQGGLTGTVTRSGASMGESTRTDQKEYVAYVSQTVPPGIDEAAYTVVASSTDVSIAPTSALGGTVARGTACGALHPNCGIFEVGALDTAIFDAMGGWGSGLGPDDVIFVNGDARFDRINMDGPSFIINGNLKVTDAGTGSSRVLHVPATASMEYPYVSDGTPTTWPCSGASTCNSTSVFPGPVQFRGFLYVKGNLEVAVSNWNMVGALLVGDTTGTLTGRLLIPNAGHRLNLAYDDLINHAVKVNPIQGTSIKLVTDLVEDVPVF